MPTHTDTNHKCCYPSRWPMRSLALLALLMMMMLVPGCAKKRVQIPARLSSVEAVQANNQDTTANALLHFYADWKGTPYRLGGMSKSAVDCSALTFLAYRDVFGLSLPRTVNDQASVGRAVKRGGLKPGDLVFFKTGFFQRHVGIYLQDSRFMHASASRGVIISRLDEPYWQKNYWKATRVY